MKVADLIERFKQIPQEAMVVVEAASGVELLVEAQRRGENEYKEKTNHPSVM